MDWSIASCTRKCLISDDTKFDAFFPELVKSEWKCRPFHSSDKENANDNGDVHTDAKSGLQYQFLEYCKIPQPAAAVEEGPHVNPEEMQYLDLCREIMETGVREYS